MNLAQLQHRAQTLRQQRYTPDVQRELVALKQAAEQQGTFVATQFETTLRTLFADVYQRDLAVPAKVTQAGAATLASAGGTRGGAVLQFHSLQASDVGKIVRSRLPELKTTTPLPVALERQFPSLAPGDLAAARRATEAELSKLRARRPEGGDTNVLDKLKSTPGLSTEQKERVLNLLAEVHAGYRRAGEAIGDKPGGAAYQDVNWKHTRLEVDRVLDVAAAAKLGPRDLEVALLASIVSDAVKTPGNFLVHNVHGAQAALHLLARAKPPVDADKLEDVARATLEHQIGPPGFMANVAMRNALKSAGVDTNVIATICEKVAKPFDERSLTADQRQVAFTPAEKAALEKIGVLHWTVPHEGSRHYKASRAVIDGDSLVNYACPDGWAKIAALHGPHQPVFLQEPLLAHALTSEAPQHASALKSFRDARSVVSESSLKLYDQGLTRTKFAIDRVLQELSRWAALQKPPKTKDGKVPYLDGALDYGNGQELAFAARLRDQGVTLLRQQEGIW